MLPRAPGCVFTPEDVELCVRETGHDMPTIKNWEKCLRFRMSHKSHAEIEGYLKASLESLEEKVISLTCPLSIYTIEITFW